MIPGPATFDLLMTAAIHFAVGIYFLGRLFKTNGKAAKAFFATCGLAMMIFTFADLLGFPPR